MGIRALLGRRGEASSPLAFAGVLAMEALGELAAAGDMALKLAMERASVQLGKGCIPIAGAAVESREKTGELVCVAVGHNGRIPQPGGAPDDRGYPTDHGETACVRCVADMSACDWSRVVFATTLGEHVRTPDQH
jgi:hypothetical protein